MEPFPASELKRAVEEAVENMPKEDRERFFRLCDSKCEEGEEDMKHEIFSRIVINRITSNTVSGEPKTALGIWRTNNFCLGRSGPRTDNGIFDTLSRFNHSCVANAEFHWNPVLKRQVRNHTRCIGKY